MKEISIAHISDVHLGYSSGKRITKDGTNLRVVDGYNAFTEAVNQMIEEKVDVVIVAGDIFHQAHPDIKTIIETQGQLRRLADEGIPVYIEAGNHDATDIRSEIPASGVLNEPKNNIFSYTEPYIVREIFPGYFFHFLSHHAYTDQGETMKQIELIDDAVNILVSHGSCFDTNMNVILHCPQEPREVVIPEFVMNMPWDYTFLGHIHERGWIGSKDGVSDTAGRKQFYGGSVIRRGFTDRPCKLERGWTKWTVDKDRVFTPSFFTVKQRPQIDCDEIDASKLTAPELEDKLIKQVKAIYNKYKEDDGTISNESAPIVRQTIKGITPVIYVAVNWSKISKFTKNFLTYTMKRIDAQVNQDVEDNNPDAIESINTSKDIVEAFDEWTEETYDKETKIVNKESVLNLAKNWLREGQNKVLDSGSED